MRSLADARTWAIDSAATILSLGSVLLARAIYRPRKALRADKLTEVRSILLVQPYNTVGDVVCTTPLIRGLAKGFPDATITVATSAHGIPGLLEENPYVTEVIPVDVRCTKWVRPLILPWRHWRMARRVLRQRKFDLAIVTRYTVDSFCSTFLAYFSGAPCRIGYTEKATPPKSVFNRGYDRLLTTVLPPAREISNEVIVNLNFLSALGRPIEDSHTEVWVTSKDRQFASAALAGSIRRRVCISPTSGHSRLKQWEVERFAELAVELSRRGCDIVLVGAAQDKPLADRIAQRLDGGCINLAGKTSVLEMAAVMSMCSLYIGGDTGPGHVASAMSIPTVSIFGSSCHHQFAPWGERNRVLTVELECSPCRTGHTVDRCARCIYDSPKCMEAITVAEVLAVALSLLDTDRRSASNPDIVR